MRWWVHSFGERCNLNTGKMSTTIVLGPEGGYGVEVEVTAEGFQQLVAAYTKEQGAKSVPEVLEDSSATELSDDGTLFGVSAP